MSARTLVNIWLLGFLTAGIEQLSIQHFLGTITSWGYSPWQTEIGLWNFGIIATILMVRRRLDHPDRAILPGLVFLSLILGTNHLISLIGAPHMWGHWGGMLANYGAIALTLVSAAMGAVHLSGRPVVEGG